MKKTYWAIIILLLLAGLFALSPWITKDYAERTVAREFSTLWEGVADGCGFNCEGCGIKGSHKTFFGYVVDIEYACGFTGPDSQEGHQTNSIYVSLFGTTSGF